MKYKENENINRCESCAGEAEVKSVVQRTGLTLGHEEWSQVSMFSLKTFFILSTFSIVIKNYKKHSFDGRLFGHVSK